MTPISQALPADPAPPRTNAWSPAMEEGVEEAVVFGVVFMGVAFREVPGRRSQWRLAQSRDRGLQGSTQCGYCVHGSHLLPTGHDRQDLNTSAARVRNRHHADCRVAVERAADRYTLICDGPLTSVHRDIAGDTGGQSPSSDRPRKRAARPRGRTMTARPRRHHDREPGPADVPPRNPESSACGHQRMQVKRVDPICSGGENTGQRDPSSNSSELGR